MGNRARVMCLKKKCSFENKSPITWLVRDEMQISPGIPVSLGLLQLGSPTHGFTRREQIEERRLGVLGREEELQEPG